MWRLGLILVLSVGSAACGSRPPIDCGEPSGEECATVAEVALQSLSADARGRVLRASVRPSSVASYLAAPGCEAVADVALEIAGAATPLRVTVSRLPDGRLVAETY